MAITEDSQFTTEKNKQAFRAVVFIDVDTATTKHWANEILTAFNGNNYENELINISAINTKVDRDGGLATVGTLSIELTNLEDYSDWIVSAGNIEGTEVRFYLVFNDGTTLTFSESLQFFTGLIDSIEIDYDRLSILVSHQDLFLDQYVGELITDGEYTDQLPEATGRMKPLVYGDHNYDGPVETADFNPDELPNLAPCRQVAPNKFVVANHELYDINADNIWAYNTRTGRYFQVDEGQVTITNTDGSGDCVIDVENSLALIVYDRWFPHETGVSSGSPTFNNIDNAIDKDLSTRAQLSGTVGATPVIAWFRYKPYDYNDYTKIIDIEHYVRYSVAGSFEFNEESGGDYNKMAYIDTYSVSGSTVTVNTQGAHPFSANDEVELSGVKRQMSGPNGQWIDSDINGKHIILTTPTDTSFTFTFTTSYSSGAYGTALVDPQVVTTVTTDSVAIPTKIVSSQLFSHDSIGKLVHISAQTGSTACDIYTVHKKITLEIPFGSEWILCAPCEGKPGDTTYMHNPSTIIEDVATTWTDLSGSDIENTDASTDLALWYFAFVIMDQIKVSDLIHQLSKASNVYSFWNHENKLKLEAYSQNPSFTSNIDEFSEVPGASGGSFSKNRIRHGSLQQTQTSISELCNTATINFKYDIVSNSFLKREKSTNNTSVAVYGTYEKIFENRFVYDYVTIQIYLSNLLDLMAWRQWHLTFDGSLQALQTFFRSRIWGRCSNTLSMACVMGMLSAQAIRLRVQDDLNEISGV